MSQPDPVPRLRLKYLLMLGALMLVFTVFIIVERTVGDVRMKLKNHQVETLGIMVEWSKVHNIFARLLLTDTFLVPGINTLGLGLNQLEASVRQFEAKTLTDREDSRIIAIQRQELANALHEGISILRQAEKDFTAILPGLSPSDYQLYSTMSLTSMRFMYDKMDTPPTSYLQVKRTASEVSGLDLYFSEVFEGKKDHIIGMMNQELERIEYGFSVFQVLIIALLIASSFFFMWQIFHINRALIVMVKTSTADLRSTLEELETTQEVLLESRRQAALSSMIVGLAHEINTPLGVAFTAQTALQDTIHQLKQDHAAGTLTQSGFTRELERQESLLDLSIRNLEKLNEQVSYFRNLSASHDDLAIHLTNLEEDLAPILEQMRAQAARRSLDFTWHLDLKGPVNTSTRAILLILTHLFQNSIDHAFPELESGAVNLDISRHESRLVLMFYDNGRGVETAHRDKIMEPFFTTSRGRGHMGLGLNIVHNLVCQQLRGTMELLHPGHGICIRISLPVV